MVRVTITGSGTPLMVRGRAGPGVLVEVGRDVKLQFDAGRGTSLRLTEAGVNLMDLTAVFLTHHHSDHLVGLTDLAISWWLEHPRTENRPLAVVAPEGQAADIAEHLLDPWEAEMTMRAAHTARESNASIQVTRFAATDRVEPVFSVDDVVVSAIHVRHEPVVPAVAYRVDTPEGAVVISGDTAVCPALEKIATGAAVLVQEAFRPAAIPDGMLSDPLALADYHAEVGAIGEMAERAGVGTLMLTHLIPPPQSAEDRVGFVNDLRRAGYHGPAVVAEDLDSVDFSAPADA